MITLDTDGIKASVILYAHLSPPRYNMAAAQLTWACRTTCGIMDAWRKRIYQGITWAFHRKLPYVLRVQAVYLHITPSPSGRQQPGQG